MFSKYDRAYSRWMPHINLIYPFIEDSSDGRSFSQAAAAVEQALSGLEPFHVRFGVDSFRCFKHGKKSCTLWLKPQTATEIQTGVY